MPRYSWLGWRSSQAMRLAVVCAALLGGGLVVGYLAYLRGSVDAAPDSPLGVGFAVAGTLLFILVGAGYVARKRLRRSRALQTALSWHIVGGILALAFILMHAAGNFHPRSGTYALYGLIAVVVSGLIGRAIDRFCPRVAAMATLRAVQTEDTMRARLHRRHREEQAALSASAQHRIPRMTPPRRRAATPQPAAPEAQWDLAYYDLPNGAHGLPPALSTVAPLSRHAGEGLGAGAVPRPQPAMSAGERASQSADILAAMERMRFAVALVRVWRHVHQLVCVVAVGLIIWHLVFAAMLIFGW